MSVSKTNNAWRYLRRSVFCLSSVWLMTALMSGLAEAQSGREQDASGQAPVSLTDLGRFNENTSVSPPTDETTPEAEDAASADNQTDTGSVSAAAEPAVREPVAAAPSAEASTGLQTNVTGRVGRRSISKIGLASIGLDQAHSADSVINSLIWSDSDAEQALALVTATPARGSSAALSALTTAITIQTAVPPKHAGPLAEQLVKARLDWLARRRPADAPDPTILSLAGRVHLILGDVEGAEMCFAASSEAVERAAARGAPVAADVSARCDLDAGTLAMAKKDYAGARRRFAAAAASAPVSDAVAANNCAAAAVYTCDLRGAIETLEHALVTRPVAVAQLESALRNAGSMYDLAAENPAIAKRQLAAFVARFAPDDLDPRLLRT